MSPYRLCLFICLVLCSVLAPAYSARVLWEAPKNIANDQDVLTTGQFKYAYRFTGNNANSSVVVNSVTFKNIAPVTTAGINSITLDSGNVTFGNSTSEATGRVSAASLGVVAEGPYSLLSSGYRGLLGAVAYNATPVGDYLVTLNHLTVGETYRVQFWANESRTPTSRRTTVIDSSVTLRNNLEHETGGLGQYATGIFTADSTSQVITINRSHYINGLSLFVVPEPHWLPMLGFVGLVGYLIMRGRK